MAQRIVLVGGAPLSTFKYTFTTGTAVKLTSISGITLPESAEKFNKVTIVVESGSLKLHFTATGEGATFPAGSIIELDQFSQVNNAYITSPTSNSVIYVYSEV
jgi:hypothetical protein